MNGIALGVAIVLFLAGLAGIFLPLLPGTSLVFAGMLIYGFLTGFAGLDLYFFLLQGAAVLVTFGVDYLASATGARLGRGSRYAVGGAILGMLLGLVFLGPLGMVLGPFLGAVAGEVLAGKSIDQAVRAGTGALLGLLAGALIKLGISLAMIAYFFTRVF
jgi:uncharacterized protein YqgC (DUF456 family)